MKSIFSSVTLKLFSIILIDLLILSLNGINFGVKGQTNDSTVLVDTDFSDWETNGDKLLAAGTNAAVSYEYDRVLGRNVIAAKLPKGLNGSNSLYVPKLLEKGKEYKVYIAYRVTAWSCISYNGATVFDGGKPLDSYGWSSDTYTFTPTDENCYFRIGTNQDDYTIYIAELKLFETVSVGVGNTQNGTGSVSAASAGVGEKVVFTASPNSGYAFSHWQDSNGNKLSNQATYEHTVTGETVLTPIFTQANDVLKYYFEDFEDGKLFDGGTTTSSSFSVASSPDGSSKYSFKHSYTSGSTYYYIKTPALSSGYTYTVSFKAYGAGENKWFRFNVHDSADQYISKEGMTASADKWTEFSREITPTADGWYIGFLMNAEVYIDDFKIINNDLVEQEPFKYYYENFEDGNLFDGGNTSSSSFVISETPDKSSSYCFKHNQTTDNKYYYIKTPLLPEGYTYKVIFKSYSVSEAKWFRFDIYDSTGTHTSVSRKGVWTTADCWTESTFSITPTGDSWYVGFLMSNEIYIDDFKIINTAFEDEIDFDEDVSDNEDADIQVGDVNKDGKITLKDIVRAKKDISAEKEYSSYSDVNYDKALDALDLGLLSKFLLCKVDYFPVGGTKPYAITLTMHDKDSYGITWNCNGLPGEAVVQICEGEKFNPSDFVEINAVNSKESSYNKSDEKSIDYYVLKAVISGLKNGKTYTYRVSDKKFGSYSEEFTFTVKDRNADTFKFIHVSDSQTSASAYLDPLGDGSGSGWAYADTLDGIKSNGGDYDFILHTGDIVEWSKYESYWRNIIDFNNKYFAGIPVMPIAGNHEATYRNGEYEIFKHFNINLTNQDKSKGVYYSFDYGNAKFIMLDTNDLSDNKIKSDQYNWLEETLKSNTQKWVIVSMHNPMYSVGKWGANSSLNAISLALRGQLSDLFAEYGVDIVLQGHDHTYSKTYPIGIDSVVNTNPQYENISGIDYCTNANGVIYIMNGPAGNQSRSIYSADEDVYELYGDSSASSWAEIEVAEETLSVKVYKYKIATKEAVLWNSYGIKK